MIKSATVIGIVALLSAGYSAASAATTILVPAEQATIQAGIDAAINYDTVLVSDGIYTGDGNRDIDFGGKAVVLISENGPEVTIIDSEGDSLNPHRGFNFHNSEDFTTVVQGFTIKGGFYYIDDITMTYGGGMLCESSSPTVANCIIRENFAMSGGGGSCQLSSPRFINCTFAANHAKWRGGGLHCSESSPVLTNCTFYADSSGHGGGGIYLLDSSSPTITGCTFTENNCYSGGSGGAIYSWGYCSPTVENCLFSKNVSWSSNAMICCSSSSPSLTNCTFFDGGIHCCYSSSPVLENCIIAYGSGKAVSCYVDGHQPCYPTLSCCDLFGNVGGDWVGCISGQGGNNGNFSLDPMFCDTAAGDFHISSLSPCAPPLNSCGVLIGVFDVGCGQPARVWYVEADGSGDALTIQEVIDSCTTFDTVMVGPGTYTGDGNRDIELRGKRITVISEQGPEQTIIDCHDSLGIHRGFYIHEGEDSSTVISGLTIRNGHYLAGSGGGLFCDGAAPTVINCIFVQNRAYNGGAVACINNKHRLTLNDCTLDSNLADYNGGAMYCGSGVVLSNCVLTDNSAYASGGAVYFLSLDTSMYSSDTSYLSGCVFANNWASSIGGAMYMANASLYSRNCTFYGHNNSYGGTITIGSYSSPVFDKCLIAFNEGVPAVSCLGTYTYPYFSCSDIYGNAGGDWQGCIADQVGIYGNFSADPWFCDTSVGDFHLFESSPCTPENSICDSLVGALDVGCWGTKTIIEPNVMTISYDKRNDPAMATVHLGNFTDGYTASDIDPASMRVNEVIVPMLWSVLPSHPEFEGEVMQIEFPIDDFLAGYGLLFDTTIQIHTVSGQFSDMDSFLVDGTVTIIGHGTGDVDDNGSVNVADVTYLVNYLFRDGQAPPVIETADLDKGGSVNVADLTLLVVFLFGGE